jgi:hypothetical protein
MDLETLIVGVFHVVDDFVRDLCRERRLRERGPAPALADSEVLTAEIVGGFLGLDTGDGLHAYFGRHFGRLLPGLRRVHRTTFLRQAANLGRSRSRSGVPFHGRETPICAYAATGNRPV